MLDGLEKDYLLLLDVFVSVENPTFQWRWEDFFSTAVLCRLDPSKS